MAFLKVFSEGRERTVFLGEEPVVCGRDESCEVLLKDIKASRRHCVVEPLGGGRWRLRDLDSGNGTRVNGQKVASAVLEPDDVVQIGDARILFAGEAAAVVAAPAAPAAAEAPPPGERPRAGARRRAAAAPGHRRLVVLLGFAGLLVAAGVLFLVFGGLGTPRGARPGEEREYAAVMDARADTERIRLAETFLGKYPDSPHAADVRRAIEESRGRLRDGTSGLQGGWSPTQGMEDLPAREVVARLEAMIDTVPAERRPAVRNALIEYRERLREEREAFFRQLEQEVQGLVADGEYARAREMWFFLRGDPNWEPIPPEFLGRIVAANEAIENAASAERGRLLEEEARHEAAFDFAGARQLLVEGLPRFKGTSVERSLAERLATVDRALKAGVHEPAGAAPVSLVKVDTEKQMAGLLARLEVRRWDEAATGLRQLATEAQQANDPGFAEIDARARECEAALALHQELVAALGRSELPKGQVAKKWRVLAGGADGLKVQSRGEEHDYPWAEVPAELYLALLAPRADALVHGDLGLAVIAEAVGDQADVAVALAQGYAAEKEREDLDRFVARRLRHEAVPQGGYVVVGGEILSRREHLRKQEEQRIKELQAQLDKSLATIRNDPAWKRLDKLKAKKGELDRARAYALELIFDEQKYFYPYRGTGREGEYSKVQQEVDQRVAPVRDLWELPMTATVKRTPELEKAFKQFEEARKGLEERLVDVEDKVEEVEFLHSYVGKKFNIRTLYRTPEERALLAYSDEVIEFNPTVPGDITPVEREQVAVTNDYRMMFGRWPVRLVEPCVKSSRGHCEEMTRLGYFGHFSPTPGRRTPYDRMKLAGYDYGASENIIAGQTSAKGAHDGWCHSSGHHRNILMPMWTEMGTGQYGRMMCQNFGQAPKWSKNDPKPGEEEQPRGYEWEDDGCGSGDGCGGTDEPPDYEDDD